MYAQPGKKLLFMGAELAQRREWNHESQLDWDLLHHDSHEGVRVWLEDLNRVYRDEPALHASDFDPEGFEWIDANDAQQSTLCFLRRARGRPERILCAFNFTPVPRPNHRIGVPLGGFWREILNGDSHRYWGSGQGNLGGVEAAPISWHGRPHAINVLLPPLSAVFFKSEG
jgi:1,4-alpha-glucan branching enzyme